MTTLDDALKTLETARPQMEALLRKLVDLNSHTQNVSGVAACQELYAAELKKLPLEVTLHPSQAYGPHLTFATKAVERAKGPLLIGHMDTVFPKGTFEGYRSDGERAFGPGVLDMKGGLVVIAFALEALHRAGKLASIPLQGAVVSEEEIGSPESQDILRAMCPRADAGLGFESGREKDLIITMRKGTGAMTVTAHGKAAHAGNLHHEGINAIWAVARFVDRAQALTDYKRGITVNVGKISGGHVKNTVPDEAVAEVDIRFHTVTDARWLEGKLREAAEEAAKSVPGSRIEVVGGKARAPLERSDASAALMQAYAECAKAAGLGSGEAPLLGGGSDAATTSEVGVPSIDGLGPRGKGFHTKEEYIELPTLVSKAQALVRFLWQRALD